MITVASGASFDKETEPEIDVLVTATSTDGSVSTETFTIAIADANEAPDLDFDPELGPGVSVTLTFVEEYAGHSNVLGVFYVDGNGNPMAGEIVWVNQNQLTPGDTATLYLEGVEANEIGYFLIPDGADTNSGLLAGDKVAFQKDGQGNWQAVGPDGTRLVGADANVLFSGNGSLNPDGYDYTVESGIRIGFEDIAGGVTRISTTSSSIRRPSKPLLVPRSMKKIRERRSVPCRYSIPMSAIRTASRFPIVASRSYRSTVRTFSN